MLNIDIPIFPQACISVAIMSGAYHTAVYGDATMVQADVVGGNWTHPSVEEDQTVSVYAGKMKFRGEVFLTCGV